MIAAFIEHYSYGSLLQRHGYLIPAPAARCSAELKASRSTRVGSECVNYLVSTKPDK